jgi:hypothetical protein
MPPDEDLIEHIFKIGIKMLRLLVSVPHDLKSGGIARAWGGSATLDFGMTLHVLYRRAIGATL